MSTYFVYNSNPITLTQWITSLIFTKSKIKSTKLFKYSSRSSILTLLILWRLKISVIATLPKKIIIKLLWLISRLVILIPIIKVSFLILHFVSIISNFIKRLEIMHLKPILNQMLKKINSSLLIKLLLLEQYFPRNYIALIIP